MASSEELVPALPDTLPENFSEWDNDASHAPAPGASDEWDSVFSKSEPSRQKAHGEPENLDAILSSFEERSRVWRSDSHAPVIARPQNEFAGLEKGTSPVPLPGNSGKPAVKDAPAETSRPVERSKETSPIPWPRSVSEPPVKAAPAETSRPAERPAESKMVFSPALENPPEDWPALSEPVFARQEKSTAVLTEDTSGSASSLPEAMHSADEAPAAPGSPNVASANEAPTSSEFFSHSKAREADKLLFEVFSAKNSEEDGEDEEPGAGKNKKKLMVVGGAAAVVLVPLILMLSLGHHGTKAAAGPSLQPVSAATETQPEAYTPDQSTNQPLTSNKPSAAAKTPQTTTGQAAQTGTEADPARGVTDSQTQMMKDQLTAKKVISGDVKDQNAENAPPPESIGTAGMDALAGSGPAAKLFDGNSKPVVKSLKPVVISSGVATGMLLRKTPPIYPSIAKTARVDGTVVLGATISKTGAIADVHVVSGPVMLRQAAVDAVRTWRYKPYELNNEPVEVETSINVVFNLAN
jgi:TonB family protein